MKKMILLCALLLNAVAASAEPPVSESLTKEIPGAKAKYGLSNFKMVMPGVLYRGGSSGGKTPMSAASAQALCNDGFDAAVYVYNTGWAGGTKEISCGKGKLAYAMKLWDRPAQNKEALKELYNIINDGKGAMYVHCWYGVHASGYLVTTALMQFCGLSASQAVAYWNSNVPAKIQYPKVQEMIRKFQPYADLKISAEQQARVCPNL